MSVCRVWRGKRAASVGPDAKRVDARPEQAWRRGAGTLLVSRLRLLSWLEEGMRTDQSARQASIERAREAMRAPGGYYRVDPVGWEHVSWSKKFPADIRALANVVLELAAALADAERQRDEALAGLWNAYVLAGSDPDGADRWHCPLTDAVRYTLAAIDELSGNYDQACDEAVAAEAALADTQARSQELLDAIEAFADATAVAAGNILRPPRED